nr:hypothetical protein [Tanacetum cinerariifolium]
SLQVPPLTSPEPDASRDAILHSDSAQLFLRHWRALDYQVASTSDAELNDYSIDLVGETMQASLFWSYRLLSRDERTVLRQLADLDGRFTLEQACNALQCATLARSCVMDCMVRLATKSLLMVSAQGPFR